MKKISIAVIIAIIASTSLLSFEAVGVGGPTTSANAQKISDLTPFTGALDDSDVFPIVDVSDTSMSASGTTKKVTTLQVTESVLQGTVVKTLTQLDAAIAAAPSGIYLAADITLDGSKTIPSGTVFQQQPGSVITTHTSVAGGGSAWTVHAGSVYKKDAAINEPSFLWDLTTGTPVALTEVAGSADIDAAGKWAWEGGYLYVRTTGSVDPDTLGADILQVGYVLSIGTDGVHGEVQRFNSYPGEIYFSNAAQSYVDWFGSNSVPGTSDMTVAANTTFKCNSGEALFGTNTYLISGRLQIGSTTMPMVIGRGLKSTIIKSTYAGDTFHIGAEPGSTASGVIAGGGIENIQIRLYNSAGVGVRLLQTTETKIFNVLIVNYTTRPNTQVGIVIDGGGGSSYFNEFSNINIVGPNVGCDFVSSGAGMVTSNTFVNLSTMTYTDNTDGIGIRFNGNNGLDSIFIGGNSESCKTGIAMATGVWATDRTQGTTWVGRRFEAQSICDIDWGNGGHRNAFYGYGNYGNNSTPGYSASLNYDNTRENLFPSVAHDDEGTWTPAFASTGATITHTSQIGYYKRTGKIVVASGTIVASAADTVTNPIQITGFPFAAKNITGLYQAGNIAYSQRSAEILTILMAYNTTIGQLYFDGNQAATPTTLGINGASGETDFTIVYIID